MIEFYSETGFTFKDEVVHKKWLTSEILEEDYELGDISYVFCDDAYLHRINVEFLKHDTYTDIITFDYSLGNEVHGEIYVSVERVRENANTYAVHFEDELRRVLVHGVLHLCGYKDKSAQEESDMRTRENSALEKWKSLINK